MFYCVPKAERTMNFLRKKRKVDQRVVAARLQLGKSMSRVHSLLGFPSLGSQLGCSRPFDHCTCYFCYTAARPRKRSRMQLLLC